MESDPELSTVVFDSKLGNIGFVAIDTFINGSAHGGVRIREKLSQKELECLSKTMTSKFGFIGMPLGGAKAGIIVKNPVQRKKVLSAFGKAITPLISKKRFFPGMDFGCSLEDIKIILESAGQKFDARLWKGKTHLYTAWGLGVAIEEAVAKTGGNLFTCTVAIEGFGRVGSETARLLHEKGAKIIAVSTIEGAVHNPKGLDIPNLLKLREKHGDKAVLYLRKVKKVPLQRIFSLETDVLVPCAMPWSINKKNVNSIKAKIICSGSNIPMEEEIEKKLVSKGLLVFPDFTANCCGVLGALLENSKLEKQIKRIIEADYRKKIGELIALSLLKKKSLRSIAVPVLENRLSEMKGKNQGVFYNLVLKIAGKILPRKIKADFVAGSFLKRFRRLSFVKN